MRKPLIIGILVLLIHGADIPLFASQADQFLGSGRDASAEEQLRNILQMVQSGRLDEARVEVESALKSRPRDERLYNFLGVIDAQEKDFTAAESSFRKAIQISPQFLGAYLNLGRLYQEHVTVDPHAEGKALRIYEQLLEVAPNNVEGNYQAAWLSNRLNAFATSQQYLDKLPAATQERPQALALRCANYAAVGQTQQASKAAQKLLTRDDLNREDMLPIFSALARHKADEFAAEFLESITQRGLASVEALEQLAELYEARGRYMDAQRTLERALQAAPSSGQILFQLAQIAYRSGDRKGALGYLAHARDIEPSNASVHFFFGMICVELNLLPDAKTALNEAVRLNPGDPYYNYALGAVLVQANEIDEAIGYFKKVQKLKPDDARARFALGVAYFYGFRYDEARMEFQAIANRPETRVGAQLFLGRMDMRDGNLDAAAKHFQESIDADPSVGDAYTELGLVYMNRREYALAEKTLERAIEIAPDSYLSNQRLLTLFLRTKDPRADAQAQRVEELRKAGQDKEHLLLRTLEIHPY